MKLITLLAMTCFCVAPLTAAQTVSYNFDTVTELNVDSPSGSAPWATAAFTDLGLNQVEMLITLDLTNLEFISSMSFNLDPSLNSKSLRFSNPITVGQFSLPSIDRYTNGVGAGQGTRFDFGFDFSTSNSGGGSRRFNGTDSLRYLLTYSGTGTFNSASFNFPDATGRNTVMAHVQNIGECGTSAWITNGSSPTIPEPSVALLLGAFGFIILLRRRK